MTITAFASGATDPDIEDATDEMGADTQYYTIVPGWTGDANMDKLEAEMEDRWTSIRDLPGHSIAAFRGDYATSQTYGNARNARLTTVLATGLSPTSPWEWASSLAALEVAESDPARPRQNLKIIGVLAPLEADRFNVTERNLLLMDGMSTYKVVTGDSYIERMVTTYQLDANNNEDPSYHDIEILRSLTYFRYGFSTRIARKYPNAKLADDGIVFAPGQVVMTPRLMRGEAMAFFDELAYQGIVEDRKGFLADLVAIRDPNNPNGMLVNLPANFVNQLRTTSATISFKL